MAPLGKRVGRGPKEWVGEAARKKSGLLNKWGWGESRFGRGPAG
jgi:hypothetical protein